MVWLKHCLTMRSIVRCYNSPFSLSHINDFSPNHQTIKPQLDDLAKRFKKCALPGKGQTLIFAAGHKIAGESKADEDEAYT